MCGPVIGVTGTVGAGKSTVSGFFGDLGARVVDADEIGRRVVEQEPAVTRALVECFGGGILFPNGGLDRRALGVLALADTRARERLNSIVHPLLLQRLREQIRRLRVNGPVVVDAALVLEWGLESELDVLIVVTSRTDLQLERMMRQRGWSADETNIRLQAQIPAEDQVRAADCVIANNGSIEELRCKVGAVWNDILH